jgi:hypothetical protein
MRTMVNRLMAGSALRSMAAFAPAELQGFGNLNSNAGADGGAGGVTPPGGVPFAEGSQQGKLIGFEDEEQETDLTEIFGAFKGADDEDDDGEADDTSLGDPDMQEVPEEKVQALQTDITNAIKNMSFGTIPEDFDVNDRAQLQGLFDRGVRTAVQQSLNVVFKPVQLAMAHMAGQMNQQIEAKIANSRESGRAQEVLESIVPEVNNPLHRPMVTSMDATLKAKGKKPQERAKTIRKMLNQMGIVNEGSGSTRRSSGSGNNDSGTSQRREGKAALDSIFGMSFGTPKK